MSDQDDVRFLEICQNIPALEALRQDVLALAHCLKGDPARIKQVWRGANGLQARVAKALEPIGLTDAKRYNELYDEACAALFCILNSGPGSSLPN